jgi:hypothetical protein
MSGWPCSFGALPHWMVCRAHAAEPHISTAPRP